MRNEAGKEEAFTGCLAMHSVHETTPRGRMCGPVIMLVHVWLMLDTIRVESLRLTVAACSQRHSRGACAVIHDTRSLAVLFVARAQSLRRCLMCGHEVTHDTHEHILLSRLMCMRRSGLDYVCGPTDIVVTTTPKAGTTWLQQICHQVTTMQHPPTPTPTPPELADRSLCSASAIGSCTSTRSNSTDHRHRHRHRCDSVTPPLPPPLSLSSPPQPPPLPSPPPPLTTTISPLTTTTHLYTCTQDHHTHNTD
jgi:hypothetical protein